MAEREVGLVRMKFQLLSLRNYLSKEKLGKEEFLSSTAALFVRAKLKGSVTE